MRSLANRSAADALDNGSFLEYAPLEFITKYVDLYPEHFSMEQFGTNRIKPWIMETPRSRMMRGQ